MIPRALALGVVLLVLPGCDKMKTAVGLASGDGGASPSAAGATPASAASLAFLESFEGEIDLSMTDKEKGMSLPTALAVLVKNGKVRFDLPEKLSSGTPLGSGYALLDTTAKKAALVSDPRKEVMVIDLNTSGEKLKALGSAPARPGAPTSPPAPKTSLTKTGKMDTVAGYQCENWDVSDDHREATVCVAQEGASWFQIPLTGIPTERLWMAELMDGKHFPLRLVGYDKTGTTESGRIEVTKIDKKPLPANEFEYPPTYRVIDLGQMLGATQTMMGNQPGMSPRMPPGMPGMPRH
jgi:hypothetical protein